LDGVFVREFSNTLGAIVHCGFRDAKGFESRSEAEEWARRYCTAVAVVPFML
jgi:hypothetical protein